MGNINNEIELCVKNLKTFSVIATLIEDNKILFPDILKIAEEITKMNTAMNGVKNSVKSILSKIE